MNMRKHILGRCPIPARRWVKTFESFYHEDDMEREIASFLDRPIEKIEFDPIYKDTSMFRAYSVQGRIDQEALEALTGYMKGEHGLTLTLLSNAGRSTASEWVIGAFPVVCLTMGNLEEACREWLDVNHSGMAAVDSEDHPGMVLYRREAGSRENVLAYKRDNGFLFVNVWHGDMGMFLTAVCGNDMVRSLLKKWVAKEYGLRDGVTIIFDNGQSYKWSS
jgi:hypothetical protein